MKNYLIIKNTIGKTHGIGNNPYIEFVPALIISLRQKYNLNHYEAFVLEKIMQYQLIENIDNPNYKDKYKPLKMSVSKMSEKWGISTTTITRAIERLLELQLIFNNGKLKGKTHEYYVNERKLCDKI